MASVEHLTLNVVSRAEIDPGLLAEIRGWLTSVFLDDDDRTVWSDPDWHVLDWLGGALVAHVDVLRRVATVGETRVVLAGVGGVVTREGWRRRGIGFRMMREAHRVMADEAGADFGLLMCGPSMTPFYERLGWHPVDAPLVYDQPRGHELQDGAIVVYPLGEDEFPHWADRHPRGSLVAWPRCCRRDLRGPLRWSRGHRSRAEATHKGGPQPLWKTSEVGRRGSSVRLTSEGSPDGRCHTHPSASQTAPVPAADGQDLGRLSLGVTGVA